MLHTLLAVFLPLFVAIDPIGLLPIFIGITSNMSPGQRRALTVQAVVTAMIISVGFVFAGNALFEILRISQADFMIAGGILLLVLAVLDLLMYGKPAVNESSSVGIVPLAMPLIAGPATLTTALVLASSYGHLWALTGLCINFSILLLVMLAAGHVAKAVGANSLRAISKLVMILLAAIAVNFIRQGVAQAIAASQL